MAGKKKQPKNVAIRSIGKCPRSCGGSYRLTKNGEDLLAHLARCMGSPRQRSKG